ncbi:MAG TPA: hypothetical protein VN285_00280 [Candidatus Deferrimicrobium sp.]|nr:hypothetical protein [Candidatus Deferrimicrobium sp.]
MYRVIVLVSALLLVIGGAVWAGQTDGVDKGRPDVKETEWSHNADLDVNPPGGCMFAAPSQVLYTLIPDPAACPAPALPRRSAFNFAPAGQVDALANLGDAFFINVYTNSAELLFSLEGDPPVPPVVGPVAVMFENTAGGFGIHADHNAVANGDPMMDDLDALEVYQTGGADDANCYSLDGDPALAGDGGIKYSVRYAPAGGLGTGYVPHSDIVNAIRARGWTGTAVDSQNVDLDGLMVRDDPDGIWNAGDMIIFSIEGPNANWDGGEIVILPFAGRPGSAFFLNHGGHLWNTAFAVGTTFSVGTEEVDAIEAADTRRVPSLTPYGLFILLGLMILSGAYVIYSRRKGVARA